jgi:hypothetical protein
VRKQRKNRKLPFFLVRAKKILIPARMKPVAPRPVSLKNRCAPGTNGIAPHRADEPILLYA